MLGLQILGISSLAAGFNFITTIINLRARGIRVERAIAVVVEHLGLERSIHDRDFVADKRGRRDLFEPEDFARHGIRLGFLQFDEFRYDTGPYAFEPGLSILDVLMWNSPQRVREVLSSHSHILDA